jgi:hypothetical protein
MMLPGANSFWNFHLITSASGGGAGWVPEGVEGATVLGACWVCCGTCGVTVVGAPGVCAAGAQAITTSNTATTSETTPASDISFLFLIIPPNILSCMSVPLFIYLILFSWHHLLLFNMYRTLLPYGVEIALIPSLF